MKHERSSKNRGTPRRRDGAGARYVQQFQLVLLELERRRRHEERQAARVRVAELEARLTQLETAIVARQAALGLAPAAGAHA